jgi:hypothetical protein
MTSWNYRLLDVSRILSAEALCVMASSELTHWMRMSLVQGLGFRVCIVLHTLYPNALAVPV